MRTRFDTGAAIHVYPPWSGEDFPVTETNQRETSTSGADIKVYATKTIFLRLNESPACCFMVALLACDITTPILSFSQLLQQGYGCSLIGNQLGRALQDPHHTLRPALLHRAGELRRRLQRQAARSASGALRETFHRESRICDTFMKRVPRGNTECGEFFADSNTLRRVHKRPRRFVVVPSGRILPKGSQTDGLTSRKMPVVTKDGADDGVFEDEWTSHQVGETPQGTEDLPTGFIDFLHSYGVASTGLPSK